MVNVAPAKLADAKIRVLNASGGVVRLPTSPAH